jgi:hypothetical protein
MQRRDALRAMVASLAGAIALPFLPKAGHHTTGRPFGFYRMPEHDFATWRQSEVANARVWTEHT